MVRKIINFLRCSKQFRIDNRKFEQDKKEYIRQTGNNHLFRYEPTDELKILSEYRESAGNIDPHYFFQDIFVAKYIFKNGFKHVYDIGSRIDGYISHLLGGGVSVTMIDIRPLPVEVENLDFIQGNAMDLSNIPNNTLPILTSLHALEHFGLGRYGDPVDYNGWKKALNAFSEKIQSDGTLIISVPCGNNDVLMFNAHRIFLPCTIYNELKDSMTLNSFTKLQNCKMETFNFTDKDNVLSELSEISKSLGKYDCGIFIFRKKSK